VLMSLRHLSATLLLATVFSLILRSLPISPLFPYTTLFRSAAPGGCRDSDRTAAGREKGWSPVPCEAATRTAHRRYGGNGATSCGDRKSTRLNSSHVSISYAVFCLKKKNQYTIASAISCVST